MWGDLAKNFGTFKAEANDLLHFFGKCLEDPKIVKFQKYEIPKIRGRISNGIEIPVRKCMYGFFLRGCPLFEKSLERFSIRQWILTEMQTVFYQLVHFQNKTPRHIPRCCHTTRDTKKIITPEIAVHLHLNRIPELASVAS